MTVATSLWKEPLMPDDLTHSRGVAVRRHAFALGGKAALSVSANDSPLMRDLLSLNGKLALHNRQLTVELARMKAQPLETVKPVVNLTPRQREVMMLVLEGQPSKNIAADLNISQRTVENHRAAIMRRTGAASLPALVRLSLGVAWCNNPPP